MIDFYKNVYQASESVNSGWNGNLGSCNAGTVSQAFRDATLLRINFFRAMAGVPADISFDPALSSKCQKATLIFSRNNTLSHSPSSSLPCYSADGYTGANKSNITRGAVGPDAVDAFMEDFGFGSGNSEVGHRRWLLYPRQVTMGFGSIPQTNSNNPASTAIYVLGAQNSHTQASAWPPAGYVPTQVLYYRWSYSYPGADFSQTRIFQKSLTSGITKEYSKYPVVNGYGDNTVVWVPDLSFPPPELDTYTVRLENVRIAGVLQTISYNVTRFNPLTLDPDDIPNSAPVLSDISVKTVSLNSSGITIPLSATDVDNDSISFSASSSSDAIDLSVNGQSLRLSPNGIAGAFSVTVTASDGLLSDRQIFKVYVIDDPGSASDSDGDGVSNSDETTNGTDPNDPGSYIQELSGPIYTTWNGFLRMINILELVNPHDDDVTITLSLFNVAGERTDRKRIRVRAQSQSDVIVNDLTGYSENSYGILKLEFPSTIDGRVMNYRMEGAGQFGRDQFDFAFGVALSKARYGKTALGFNTFQPSNDSRQQQNQVTNWLSIVSLASVKKKFVVKSYNAAGTEIMSRVVTVPKFGRVDIDGGHEFAGSSVVGLHVIEPTDPKHTPYLAQLTRYGENNTAGLTPSSYSFAFPMAAQAGNGRTMFAPLSRQFGEDNWVEVANTLNKKVKVRANFYNAAGQVAKSVLFSLAPHSQRHFFANSYLPAGSTGTVKITPQTANSIIAQSMFYFRNSATGAITSMYGIAAEESRSDSLFGSFNLFLNMDNWLRITNTQNTAANIEVETNSANIVRSKTFKFSPKATRSIPLHGATDFRLADDSYGTVKLIPKGNSSVSASITRIRPDGDLVDFAAPTTVR